MAQQNQILKPRSINLDSAKKYLKDSEAAYLLNFDVQNPSAIGKGVPFAANMPLCEMDLPQGENYNNGRYFSPITNEEYSWTWNENGINFISRINEDGLCQIVYTNDSENNFLQLSANPTNEITKWRAYLQVEKSDCANRHGKYLCWTNGNSSIGWLDVEASIATESFSTPFFDGHGSEVLQLCAPQPCGCITAQLEPLIVDDASITNNILDKGFKFIYRGVYYDNLRTTEWSDPSTMYYQDTEGCFYGSKGIGRCWKLSIPVTNPLWDKIEIGYSKGDIDGNGDGIWYLADTVDVYEKYNSTQQYWYQRQPSPDLKSDNIFEYNFCNNKQCQVIDFAEVTRVFNPIPLNAQGLIPINNGLGFYNYEQGNCPVDKNEVDKFKITKVEQQTTDCLPQMRELKVRLIVHCTQTKFNQFIWRKKGELTDDDDITDTAYFGGLQEIIGIPTTVVINSGRQQNFSGKTRGFIVYVEGTQYFAETKQYSAGNGFLNNSLTGVLAGGSKTDFPATRMNDRNDNTYYYQEATLLIPVGMKGFIRVCSQKATGLEPDSSTKLAGTISNIAQYRVNIDLPSFNQFKFEIPFSCDDTALQEAFIVNDASLTAFSTYGSSVETVGYIKDNIGNPLEGLEIWAGFDGYAPDIRILAKTDHNGYYNLYSQIGQIKNSTAQIRAEIDCSTWNKLQSIVLNRSNHNNDGTMVSNATIANTSWLENKYYKLTAKVIDCNNNPVQGVKVAFSGSKSQVTTSDGTAYIKARNYSTRNRQITAIVMSKYGCYTVDCNNICNPCAPYATKFTPACYTANGDSLPAMKISLVSALKNLVGLKAGGNYPMGFVLQGDCGKISAVNELPAIQIDKTQKKGRFSFPTFQYSAVGIALPDWVTCVKIVRGVNLNNYELQWLVDKVEKTADRKLKITIQSLNDYNSTFFFKTNTNYQYLSGDRVEFIRNGDGKIFDSTTYGLLNYQILSPFLDQLATGETTSAANYFNQILIDDDGKLTDLKAGALIELQRSKECVNQPVYFSICAAIPTIVDGQGITRLVAETGNFNTFDTYFIQRQVGSFSIQTFESKSPSDFWGGTGIDDTGKPYFVNKYENQKRYGRNISIAPHNAINRFGDMVKTFDAPEQGDITSMNIVDGKIILAIGENDSFLAQVSNDLVRVGSDGIIRAASTDQIISDAEPKLRGQFGCQYEDVGSVFYGDGFATWVDGDRNAHVTHNYREAKDISLGKMQTYFRNKIQQKNLTNNAANNLDKLRWVVGQNKVNGTVYLTIKSLHQPEINNDYKPLISTYSTISFNADAEEYLSFHSFVPEGYSELNLKDEIGCSFIVYYKGIPYLHPIKSTVFNQFFGKSVDMIATLCVNKFPEKLKNFIAIELQSDQRWYLKSVETNDPNFESEVPPIAVKAVGDKWSVGFLGNKNSLEGIFSGRMPSGYYCLVTFIKNNTLNLVYNSIDDLEREKYSELDMINCKFNLLEQSGFTENL